MSWIYLSPHFDDVALSCGGLVWEQTTHGDRADIWTICAGDPPPGPLSTFAQSLHTRWQAENNAPVQRKDEDTSACLRLGAGYRHFKVPDCIYRRHPQTGEFMYASEAGLNGPLNPGDRGTIQDLALELRSALPAGAIVVCPLAFGNHVDHQLTRRVAEQLGQTTWYYADYPYVLRCHAKVEQMLRSRWEYQTYSISPEGLTAWQDSISLHHSQISTFWSGEEAMRTAINDYLQAEGGIHLWHPAES